MIATPIVNPPISNKFSFEKSFFSFKNFFISLKQPYNYIRTYVTFTCSKSTIETPEKVVQYV